MIQFCALMTPNTATSSVIAKPPVVVVLGHVDHGKTTLLDSIREANVASGESGGITQHIGAYQVEVNNRTVTFLDTPGHEAFSAIRSRGARVADVAVLVVAADESVKPQTVEAIKIIKDAKIPFVVAINKSDKSGANSQRVKQDLAQYEVLVEDWGGQIPSVEISAKQNSGIKELLDIILLVADMQEITADPMAPARGVIIESHKDQRRGFVATVLIQNGTLRIGDWIVAGHVIGKIKSMDDFRGKSISEAGLAVPVAIAGWPESPQVGAEFNTAIAKRAAEDLAADNVTPPPVAFDTFRNTGSSEQSEEKQTLNVLFKADVASSIEAINQSVADINHDEVQFRVLGSSVGDINEADVQTAAAKGAIIYAFRVGIDSATTKRAERDGIRIRSFDVIYELTDALREDLATLLPSATERTAEGTLKILAIFCTDAKSRIIGGKVVSGSASRGALIDLVRGDERIRVGRLVGVQHNKEDRESVAQGLEAGLRIDTSAFTGDISVGDTLEFVREQTVKRTL